MIFYNISLKISIKIRISVKKHLQYGRKSVIVLLTDENLIEHLVDDSPFFNGVFCSIGLHKAITLPHVPSHPF